MSDKHLSTSLISVENTPFGMMLHYSCISSTQEIARSLLENMRLLNIRKPLIIRAHEQTEGRGQWGRVWESQAGNLFFSMLFPIPQLFLNTQMSAATLLPFISCVAVGEVIDKALDFKKIVKFKWPNDVLINESKVSGILIEYLNNNQNNPEFIIVGIGVNYKSNPPQNRVSYSATHLLENGCDQSLDDLFYDLCAALHQAITEFFLGIPTANILKKWRDNAKGVPPSFNKDV